MPPLNTSVATSNASLALDAVSRANGYRDSAHPGGRELSARTAGEEEATRRALNRLETWLRSGDKPRGDSPPGSYLNIRV